MNKTYAYPLGLKITTAILLGPFVLLFFGLMLLPLFTGGDDGLIVALVVMPIMLGLDLLATWFLFSIFKRSLFVADDRFVARKGWGRREHTLPFNKVQGYYFSDSAFGTVLTFVPTDNNLPMITVNTFMTDHIFLFAWAKEKFKEMGS